jgi:hypothetical protein
MIHTCGHYDNGDTVCGRLPTRALRVEAYPEVGWFTMWLCDLHYHEHAKTWEENGTKVEY